MSEVLNRPICFHICHIRAVITFLFLLLSLVFFVSLLNSQMAKVTLHRED